MSNEQNIRSRRGRVASTLEHVGLDVTVSAAIEAESRRVLYALTIPEYMEAWLEIPAAEKLQCSSDPKAPNCFHIDVYSADVRHASIEFFCLLLNSDRVMYLWKNLCIGSNAETMVGIRLKSSSGQCIVNLNHSGFRNIEESLWHSRMWRSSLNKLCSLMTAVSGTARASTASHGRNSSEIHPVQSVISPPTYRRS
jgi:hypothetical protein